MNLVEFTPIGASNPRFAIQFGNQKINIHQAKLPFNGNLIEKANKN